MEEKKKKQSKTVHITMTHHPDGLAHDVVKQKQLDKGMMIGGDSFFGVIHGHDEDGKIAESAIIGFDGQEGKPLSNGQVLYSAVSIVEGVMTRKGMAREFVGVMMSFVTSMRAMRELLEADMREAHGGEDCDCEDHKEEAQKEEMPADLH